MYYALYIAKVKSSDSALYFFHKYLNMSSTIT